MVFNNSKILFFVVLIFYIIIWLFIPVLHLFGVEYTGGWFSFVCVFCLLYIFPFIMLLILGKICFIDVVINDIGITKKRFGKVLLTITWDELQDVELYNPVNPWIVFAKQSLNGVGLDKARLFMHTISFIYVLEVKEEVIKYCTNENILKKINSSKYGNV